MADHNHKIAAQLQSVAKAFLTMDDDELMLALMDTCNALLDEVEKRRPAVADMDRMERSEYTIGYRQISGLIGNYARELQDADPTAAPAEDPADHIAQLESQRTAIAAQRSRNEELKAEVERNSRELNSLQEFHATMMEMGKTCTRKIINDQKEQNQKLLTNISKRQGELEELEAEERECSKQLERINTKIRQVEDKIAHIPEVNKNLAAVYTARQEELKLLQNAQELCSAEKQAELEKQILEMKPVVEKMEQKMNTLNNQLENFRESSTELDRENQILRTQLIEYIDKAMGELGLVLEEHQQTLAEIQRQADTYRNSLAECERSRNGLVQWLGSDRRQLDAALAAIDRQEYTNLQQTLNISTQNQVCDAFAQARTALEQVDRILAQCALAAQKDQAAIRKEAVR